MKPIPFIRASSGLAFAEWLAAAGVSIERLWTRAGLPARALLEPEQLVPLELINRFAEDAAVSAGVHDLGVRVAARSGFGSVGRFGVAIRRAPTLLRAIETARDLVPMHNSGARCWLVEEGASVRLCRRLRVKETRFGQHDLLTVTLMVDLVRAVAGPDWLPARVELQSSGVLEPGSLDSFGDAQVEVARPATSVTFSRAFLGRPLPQPAVPAGADGDAWPGNSPPSDFLTSLEAVIAMLLESGHADLGTAAMVAGTSVRSFQRRLAELDASYSDVVDQVRFRTATRLLEDSSVKIIEIALALGYSDPAHFTRAFRRWTSSTPMEYRHLHVNGGHATRRSA
jgi:AraC-like DNA-binding protein